MMGGTYRTNYGRGATSTAVARGRRRELAYAVSRQAFEQRLVTVIQELEYGTIPRVATRPRVANQLSMCVDSLYTIWRGMD